MKRTLILLFALFCSSAIAEQVSGLYNGRVLVADQSEQSRQQGVRQALEQVLIKLTGNSKIMQLPGIQEATANTNNFISSVGYSTLPDSDDDSATTVLTTTISNNSPLASETDVDTVARFALQVSFSTQAVDQLLHWAQLPVLPVERPRLLFWIVRDDAGSGRQFINDHDFPDFSQHLEQIMHDRAIPYRWPALDLEDQLALSVNEAWGMREQTIDRASQRYDVDGWALLRFFTTNSGEARGTWTYHLGEQRGFNDVRAESGEAFVTLAVNDLVDSVATHLSYIPQTDTSTLLVQINQVGSYADYRAALEQLQSLKLVQSTHVTAVKADRLFVSVTIDGGVDLLISALERSGRLVNQTSRAARFSGNLEFDWTAK